MNDTDKKVDPIPEHFDSYEEAADPSLVTALTDLPEGMVKRLSGDKMPGHLVTGNGFILSRINGPEAYETLATLTSPTSRFTQP